MGVRVSMAGATARKRRKQMRSEFWPEDRPWLGSAETGYFCAPRTLPLVLAVLRRKSVSADKDPSGVYLDLLASHMGEGLVELGIEEDHAFSAGYANVRSWRDRMRVLEEAGFIKALSSGNRKYARVLLLHPSLAMHRLHEEGKISEALWQAYRARQITMKEASSDEVSNREPE